MKIGIIIRPNADKVWGGDLKALNVIKKGLEQLNHEVKYLDNSLNLSDEDIIFISNTTLNLSFLSRSIKSFFRKKYCLIPFHEDFIKYDSTALGLYRYIQNNLNGVKDGLFDFSIERLIENPSLVYYFSGNPRKDILDNYEVIKNAELCIASSNIEKNTLFRDCPSVKSQVVHWTSGCEDLVKEDDSDDFLKLCGLIKGSYLLQVGRLQIRKNQLSTILAAKDLDIPLVFISTANDVKVDLNILIAAILKYRKAKTIIVSQDLPAGKHKHLHIINMPNNKILGDKTLKSAYINCGLYIHPAFYELPGYVYLEAAMFGVPIIASEWTSIKEYFSDIKTGRYLLDDRISYVNPLDIKKMTELIIKNIGKRYPNNPDLWVYKRKPIDVAREILNLIT